MLLSRRNVLAGLGAAATLPLLQSVARAQTAVAAPRLALFVSGGWFPPWAYDGGSSFNTLKLGPSLQPLAKWADRIKLVQGLHDVPGDQRQNPSNAHENIGRWLLTNDKSDAAEMSIDNAVGEKIQGGAPNRSLGWLPWNSKNYYRVYKGSNDGAEASPGGTYNRLFKGLTTTGPAPAATLADKRRDARLRALDHLEAASERIGDRLSGAHKDQIAVYIENLSSFGRANAPMVAGASCEPPDIANVPGIKQWNTPRNDPQEYPRTMKALVDASIASQICDLTRSTTVFFSTDDNFPDVDYSWIPALQGRPIIGDHGTSHDGAPNNEAGLHKMEGYKWYAGEIARFASALEQVPVAGGKTMLDQTMIIWVQAFGSDHSHSRTNHMAMIMNDPLNALRGSTKFLDFGDQKTMGDFWATIMAAMTDVRGSFGLKPSAPIADLLR